MFQDLVQLRQAAPKQEPSHIPIKYSERGVEMLKDGDCLFLCDQTIKIGVFLISIFAKGLFILRKLKFYKYPYIFLHLFFNQTAAVHEYHQLFAIDAGLPFLLGL